MKIFWAIVGVLLLGAILVTSGALQSSPQTPALNGPQIAPVRSTPAAQPEQPAPARGATPSAVADQAPVQPTPVQPAAPETETSASSPATWSDELAEPPSALADFAFIPDPVAIEVETLDPSAWEAQSGAQIESEIAIADEPAAAQQSAEEPASGQPSAPAIEIAADGRLTIGGRFEIPGTGTQADPYEIPWDLLVSAQSTYRSRQTPGQEDELPAWSSALDDKHVRVKGFLMLPMTGDSGFSELLLMRNQWDGCCAGLPPTAYDAIEVSMAQPAKIDRWTTNYGTLVGRFEVDPYLSGGWVIGLWLLKDAAFEDASGVGTIGHWGGGS